MEFRGHGNSGRVAGRYRPEDYLEDTMAFVERQIAEPAVFFGHSMGGLYAVSVADQVPEKVRALVVGDIPLSNASWAALPDNVEYWATVRNLAAWRRSVRELVPLLADIPVPDQDPPTRYGDLPEVDATTLREWAKTLIQLDPDVVEFQAEGRKEEFWGRFDVDAMLPRISCPTLLLQGNPSLGGLMTDGDVEHALSVLPDAAHVLIEHAGHDLGLGTWEVAPLVRGVMDFLESL